MNEVDPVSLFSIITSISSITLAIVAIWLGTSSVNPIRYN